MIDRKALHRTRAMRTSGRLVLAVLGLAATLIGAWVCLPRYAAVAPGDDPWPAEQLAETMNPWLLATGYKDRTLVEIDWVEGCAPGPATLGGLTETLKKYSPADRSIEVVRDQEIPQEAWNELRSAPNVIERLVEKYAAIEHAREQRTEWLYVLFVPDAGRYFGHTISSVIVRDGVATRVSGVVVSRNAHLRYARGWISLDSLERMTLVHEFGHELGLVGDPRHGRSDPAHRNHCTSLTCVMAHPTGRVIARNLLAGIFNSFLADYCVDCQADIRRAQAFWKERDSEGAAYRSHRESERAAESAADALWPLEASKQYAEMLDRVREFRRAWPTHAGWDEFEARALTGIGRPADALPLQLRALPSDTSDPRYWKSRCSLASLYVVLGRYAEAIALLDTSALEAADEQDLEQSSFILESALASCGRYGEASATIDRLLARNDPQSYSPERIRVRRAEFLRRAGRLEDADRAIGDGLGDRQRRNLWLEQAARLRHAQGREADAQALWQERLSTSETATSHATTENGRAVLQWIAVQSLANLGKLAEARERAASLAVGPGIPKGSRQLLWTELPARAALSDFDRIADLIRSVPIQERGQDDPCSMEDLESMRRLPRYDDLFVLCPKR